MWSALKLVTVDTRSSVTERVVWVLVSYGVHESLIVRLNAETSLFSMNASDVALLDVSLGINVEDRK